MESIRDILLLYKNLLKNNESIQRTLEFSDKKQCAVFLNIHVRRS